MARGRGSSATDSRGSLWIASWAAPTSRHSRTPEATRRLFSGPLTRARAPPAETEARWKVMACSLWYRDRVVGESTIGRSKQRPWTPDARPADLRVMTDEDVRRASENRG